MMSRKLKAVLLISFIYLTLVGCTPAPEATPLQGPADTKVPDTAQPEPTATEELAVDTREPTAIPYQPTLTPLPAGVLFRDDFDGELQPGWEWENENPERWAITDDGWLEIVGEHDSLLGHEYQNNLLWYPLPGGDFVITVHLKTSPYENFQQATIYLYEDPENFIALNRGYCDICQTGGGGFYMEYKIGGKFNAYQIATDAEDVYLRLESKGTILSGYYATEPDQWKRIGRFGDYFDFKNVGIGVTNSGTPNDVIGLFDYFEISLP